MEIFKYASNSSKLMHVKDIKPRQGKIDIELEVVDIGEIREFNSYGKKGTVVSAIAKDDTGKINLTLWNDEIDRVKVGSKIRITNGYCSEFQGERQLSAGRYGKLEVLG